MSCSTAACRQGVGSKMPNVTPPRQEIAHCSVKPSPHAPYLDATDAPSPLPAAALLCYDRRDSERPPALRQSVAPGRSSHDLGGRTRAPSSPTRQQTNEAVVFDLIGPLRSGRHCPADRWQARLDEPEMMTVRTGTVPVHPRSIAGAAIESRVNLCSMASLITNRHDRTPRPIVNRTRFNWAECLDTLGISGIEDVLEWLAPAPGVSAYRASTPGTSTTRHSLGHGRRWFECTEFWPILQTMATL